VSQFTVDKGIPLPPDCRNGGRAPKYPFGTMEIGDSFFIAVTVQNRFSKQRVGSKITANAAHYKRHNPKFKIAYRAVEGGIRIWRIA